jgi:hypothetical protein
MGKKDLDARTDLYSFGVMLYEMVVGRVPFSADTPFSIIHDHIYSPLPMPRDVNPNVPESVERVLLKALAKEREDRYENSTQLVNAFKEAWKKAGVPAQGSDISLAATMVDTKSSVPSPEPVKAAVAETVADESTVAETVAQPEVKEESQATQKDEQKLQGDKPPHKRSPMRWIVAVILLLLCVGAIAVARDNRVFSRLAAARSEKNPPANVNSQQPAETAAQPFQSQLKAKASKSEIGKPASNVLDGDMQTTWSSGADPEQWIQIDLGSRRDFLLIRMYVSQFPSGETTHEIWAGTRENNLVLLDRISGFTSDVDELIFNPTDRVRDVRYIRIVTTKSPSWVAWREIEVVLAPK